MAAGPDAGERDSWFDCRPSAFHPAPSPLIALDAATLEIGAHLGYLAGSRSRQVIISFVIETFQEHRQ